MFGMGIAYPAVVEEPEMQTRFGEGLKDWRRRRGMSQLRLGLAADVSARHIAFLETGRANPTRTMVIRLAEALEVPRGERNGLLEAAGFAAAYASRDIATEEMASIRTAISRILERHEPYPGFAFDRQWVLFDVNSTARRMFANIGLEVGSSLIKAMAEPGAMRAAIENWPEVAQHMCARLRTESRHLGGDPLLDAAAARLAAEADNPTTEHSVLPAVITTRYRAGDAVLSFFSAIAQFGSTEDIALADLKIELLFPLDDMTRKVLIAVQAGDGSASKPPTC